jgi:hypothetical protein
MTIRPILFSICLMAIQAILLIASAASAYPEFIGYGYTECINCHTSGFGGGPLSDYGRALWSGEIASHAVFPQSMSDDDIAASSGFLGPRELPEWFRPHLKYRGLWLNTNPGSGSSSTSKYFHMQSDIGVSLKDKMDRYLAVLTFGRELSSSQYGAGLPPTERILAREYYLRTEIVKSWWVYAGLMEKVFGLRNIDHSSYQREHQTFNVQNNTVDGISESEGVIVQKTEDDWSLAINGFFGNPYDDTPYVQKGVSAMGEYTVGERKRLGASILSAKSDVLTKQMAAIHYRQGLSQGSAFIFEWGLIKDVKPASTTDVGSYALLQTLIQIARGYNVKTTVERYNRGFNSSSPEAWRWSAGLLMFPMPRLELRTEIVNDRSFSNQSTGSDTWSLEGQVHVSL